MASSTRCAMVAWATAVIAIAACGGDTRTPDAAPALPALSSELPPAGASMGARRGLTPARGIIHLHSPYSHDACDGRPRDDSSGAIDEQCLADLRAALCATRVDFAALTDHDDSMADEEFVTLFSARDDDELITNGAGEPVASRMMCSNGHRVLVFVGGENDLMPIMLDRHPEGTVGERHAIYNADDPATVELFRQLGGITWIAHTEGRTLDELRTLAPDGFEIYNLHANIDPDIREDDLGLPAGDAIQAVAAYADNNPGGPEPDLALLSFLSPNHVAIDHWDALLGEGFRISGSGGTDAHQNALPILLRDGERGDSFRRMIRWFSNVALVSDPGNPVEVEDAVRDGRLFVAFELFGTPSGFDVVAKTSNTTVELGGELSVSDGATLEVTVPVVFELDASLPQPSVSARILRIDQAGATPVADGAGPVVSAPLDAPGAYRVEVTITPRHLGPYLGRLGTDDAEREHVWIYANPIYVTPAP